MNTVTPTTSTLPVENASLYYEVRGSGPLLVLHAAPMDAASFAPVADLLAVDHTVVTSDPRGINRSWVDHPDQDVTPEMRAGDLAALLRHLDAGPATVFGSSGGAVSALALVQAYPDRVRAIVAHEPPLAQLVDDTEKLRRETEDMISTYLAGDRRGTWTAFMESANIHLPPALFEELFGGEIHGQAAADELFSFAHMERATTFWTPDLAALRACGAPVVIAIGERSVDELCDRTSRALAAELGVHPQMFPGGHVGFAEDPEAFTARLREVLAPL